VNRLREYRERYGWSQEEVIAEIHRRALQRGDPVAPGLDQPALSRHENGRKRPGPRNRDLYCLVYGATPAELGFLVALPGQTRDPEDVDRREFLAGAAGLIANAAVPGAPTQRLGRSDIERLRQNLMYLRRLDDQHGSAPVYAITTRTFERLRGLVERARYDHATGQELRALVAEAASRIGWLDFDAGRHNDARRWQLEALNWARLADADPVGAMAAMARLAAEDRQPRQAIDLAAAAQRTAKATTPRLRSMLAAREALGHAQHGDATSTHAALRRARAHTNTSHPDDPIWLAFYGPADFAAHEQRAALMLGDLAAAEDAARTAHALDDPVAYPRTFTLGLIELADVLARRRKIDESAAHATQAAVAATDLDSGRVTRGLRDVAERLEPYRGNTDVGAFLALV
jgi:transcriptional regulator with XRE-family HTH domain